MKFLERMFTAFLTRANPLSTMAKPRFMKNTSTPAKTTQMLSRMTCISIDDTSTPFE